MNTKKLSLKFLGLALMGLVAAVPSVDAFTNPSSVTVKIYEVRMSRSLDCSNSVAIFSNPNGVSQDMVTNPTLGSGAVPNGSYQCIMVKLSNQIIFTPTSTDGFCTQGQTLQRNVFRANGGDISIDPFGTTIQGAGTSTSDTTEVAFWAYFKIGGGTNDCKTPANACTLTSPILISGDRSGTIVVDFDGKIDGSQNPCDLQAPVFSFR